MSQIREDTYIIAAHGKMFSKNIFDKDYAYSLEYYACIIPTNVELYTYIPLKERFACTLTTSDFICSDSNKVYSATSKSKTTVVRTVIEPKYVTKGNSDSPTLFPNIFLEPENDSGKLFYSGITYCNKDTPNAHKSEVIYNIDAKKTDRCLGVSVSLLSKKLKNYQATSDAPKPYNYDKHYSDFYKSLIQDDPKKCGPILLEDAITLIQQHSAMITDKHSASSDYTSDYTPQVSIKIYLQSCLTDTNFDCDLYEFNNHRQPHTTNFTPARVGPLLFKKLHIRQTVPIDKLTQERISINPKIIKYLFHNKLIIITISDDDIMDYNNIVEQVNRAVKAELLTYDVSTFPATIKITLDTLGTNPLLETTKGKVRTKLDEALGLKTVPVEVSGGGKNKFISNRKKILYKKNRTIKKHSKLYSTNKFTKRTGYKKRKM